MTITIKTQYLGQLRTQLTHVKSGNVVITDAPLDNNGKGEAFSPTDLLAASLASCMITIMGIVANKNGLNIDGVRADVTKIMSAAPRKVAEIIIDFSFAKNHFSDEQKAMLYKAALNCPVALSLSEDVKKTVNMNW